MMECYTHIMSFCENFVSRQVEALYLNSVSSYMYYIPYLVGSFKLFFIFHSARDNPSH